MSEITTNNFEDGQYDMDDSMYTDEDNEFLEAELKKLMEEHSEQEEN